MHAHTVSHRLPKKQRTFQSGIVQTYVRLTVKRLRWLIKPIIWVVCCQPRGQQRQLCEGVLQIECACLKSADNLRVNAFHCRCLRSISGIRHSVVLCITNAEMLRQGGGRPLARALTVRQLLLFGKAWFLPDSSIVRRVIFVSRTKTLKQFAGVRKRGRPKLNGENVVNARVLTICTDGLTDL